MGKMPPPFETQRDNDPARYPARRANPPKRRSNLFAIVVALVVAGGAGTWWWLNNQEETPVAVANRPKPALAAHPAPPATNAFSADQLQPGNSGGGNFAGNHAGGNSSLLASGAVVDTAAAPAPVFELPPGAAGLAGAGVLSHANGVVDPVTARLSVPYGVAMDANGNVFVADMAGALHRITPDGEVGASTGSGTFGGPIGAVTDANGNIIVADWQTGTVKSISPDGNSYTTLASSATSPILSNPTAVATDAAGNVYVASNDNNTIVRIAPDGTVTTFAGTVGQNGSTDGTLADALFNKPRGLATDAEGDVYVADEGNSNIREIMPDGTVKTIAGGTSPGSADGVGSAASFNAPRGVTVDSNGDVFVADTNNDTIREIKPDGTVTTVAGTPGQAGNADGPASQALFNAPRGVSVDASGNIYVTDTGNAEVRRIAPNGTVTTVASAPAGN
jgi:sugar lactone lactonase YvrE